MSRPLLVLILEDNAADFALISNELARFGLAAHCQKVETEADLSAWLGHGPDLILAGDSLSGFDRWRALEILQSSGHVLPYIVLTAGGSEDQAVEYIKKGAADYLEKSRILKLGPAVERALEEAKLSRQKAGAEQALRSKNRDLEEQYRRA